MEKLFLKLIDLNNKINDIVKNSGYENQYEFIITENKSKTLVYEELIKTNKKFKTLSDSKYKLHDKIYKYYSNEIVQCYNKFGKEETVKLFYTIKNILERDENYEEVLSIIVFELAFFTGGLIKK